MTSIQDKLIGRNKIIYTIHNVLDPLEFYKYYSRGINLERIFCQLDIEINLKTYFDKREFYDISYIWTYSKNPLSEDQLNPAYNLHPFYKDKQFIENHNDGEVIFKNSLSDKIVEFLLLPIDQLKDQCGSVSHYQYQKSLLKIITTLWD